MTSSEQQTPPTAPTDLPPMDWYPDPADPLQERYWDGTGWTHNVRERGDVAANEPALGAAYQPEAGWPGSAGGPAGAGPAGYDPAGYDPAGHGTSGYGPSGSGDLPAAHSDPNAPRDPCAPRDPWSAWPSSGIPDPAHNPYLPAGAHDPRQRAHDAYYAAATPYALDHGAQATHTADGVPLAGWWWRALAELLDELILSVLYFAIGFSIWREFAHLWMEYVRIGLSGTPVQTSVLADRMMRTTVWLSLLNLGISLVANTVFFRFLGSTPGRLICGLRIVPLDQGEHPRRLSWSTAIVRSAVGAALNFLSPMNIIGFLVPLWAKKRQSLCDMIARTQVVRKSPR